MKRLTPRILALNILLGIAWVLYFITSPLRWISRGAFDLLFYTTNELYRTRQRQRKYVVLMHIRGRYSGKMFWSTNSKNNTHLNDGTWAYREIFFTDDEQEAIKYCN